ncbi:MAG TPA: serine hydrolase [Verrucomicrobiae bacterium]|nr:serine hydrolase [Verrucomicrobiae bacterium]
MTIRLTRYFGLIGATMMTLAMVLAAALPSAAENPEDQAEALLNGVIRTNDPGLAVLVAQHGKILFEKGYGLADRAHHVAVIPQTTFRIGSITKQFTASAILKLQEEGKLSVDDKLSKYIPDFPRGDEVTLRHLLTHTSGIHSYTDEPDFMSRVTNATTTESVIEEMKKYPYDFDPGAKWSYDNSGYMLLGYIVEKVSGQSYGDFLRENFFEPLGMIETGVYHARPGPPHEALGYSLGTKGFKRALNWDMSWAGGAGALYSTVEDLYRWDEGVFNGRVLDDASLKEAFTPVKTKQNQGYYKPDNGYGFGWMIDRYRELREISHGGGLQGFSSFLLRVPDAQFTVAILANALPGRPKAEPDRLAQRLVEIFLADKLAPLPVANTNVSPESYDALTGRYDLLGGILTVSRRGPHLLVQLTGQLEGEIFPRSDTEFFAKVVDAQFTFVKDSSGKAIKLVLHQNGLDLDAPRTKDLLEAKVDPAAYDSVAGQYDYGGGAVMTVTHEGDHLFAQLTGQSKYEIFPESETNYFWKVVDAQVTFVKDNSGKVIKAIHHQNGRTFDAPRIR